MWSCLPMNVLSKKLFYILKWQFEQYVNLLIYVFVLSIYWHVISFVIYQNTRLRLHKILHILGPPIILTSIWQCLFDPWNYDRIHFDYRKESYRVRHYEEWSIGRENIDQWKVTKVKLTFLFMNRFHPFSQPNKSIK